MATGRVFLLSPILELSLLKRAEWSKDSRRQRGMRREVQSSGQKEAEAAVAGLVLMRI